MKIYLDTNFLKEAAKKKIDYQEEIGNLMNQGYELLVPETAIKELKKLSKGRGKENLAASLALKILSKNKLKIVKTKKIPDDFLKENINPEDLVASMDSQLLKIIKNKKITIGKNKKIKVN